MAFSRIDEEGDELLVVCNFSDTACDYKLGLPEEKTYTVIFDSNLTRYGRHPDRGEPADSAGAPGVWQL